MIVSSVSRLKCKGENYDMNLVLDINTDIFPVQAGGKFSLALASTLRYDGQQVRGFRVVLRLLNGSSGQRILPPID